MKTCTVGAMRKLMDSIANVVPYITLSMGNGMATFRAFDTHRSVLCTAQLPVAFEADGCAHMHVPSCRAALRSVNSSTPLQFAFGPDTFTMGWDNQKHQFTHIRFPPIPELAPCVVCGVFAIPSADLLKFARDSKALSITFRCDGLLHVTAVTDTCTSEYTAEPYDDPLGPSVTPQATKIQCTTRNLVSIAKAALFSKQVIIQVGLNEVVFVYRKDLSTFVSFVLARAI